MTSSKLLIFLLAVYYCSASRVEESTTLTKQSQWWDVFFLYGRIPNVENVNNNITRGMSKFSADFYIAAKTSNGGRSRNWIFSPFSLSAAFAMLKVGTRGATSSQLEKAFYYPPSDDALASGFHSILQTLNGVESSPQSDFSIASANRLYIDNQFEVLPSYLKILNNSFGSGIERLKLNPAAASVINKWVENVTRDKIRDLISPEDLDDTDPNRLPKFVLVNAIYFLGKWENQFEQEKTRNQNFFLSEQTGDFVEVEMMHQELTLQISFLRDIDADVFKLPYRGGRFSMLVFLPRSRGGLTKIENNLKSIPSLSQLGPQLKVSRFTLAFPKFRIETTIDATKILSRLGVHLIFSTRCKGDFSGLAAKRKDGRQQCLVVTKAVQKAVIIVDEEGTEAAAATTIVGFELTMARPRPPDLVVDHPFYYQIVDQQNSGLILFAGSCTNPNQN